MTRCASGETCGANVLHAGFSSGPGRGAEIKSLIATRDLVFAHTPATAENRIRVFKAQAEEGKHLAWWVSTEGQVMDLRVDADDLYIVVSDGREFKLSAYQISNAKFRWKTWISADFASALSQFEGILTANHLVLTQNNWDPTGQKASHVVLIERRTGKAVFDAELSSDPTISADGTHAAFTVQVFDGGLAVTQAKQRTCFMAAADGGNDEKSITERYEKNPDDPDAVLRWARLQYDKGDHAKGLAALAKVLDKVPDEKFAFVYDTYAKMRSHDALKNKPVLKFAKLGKAPKLDGNLDDWKDVAEQKFDGWSNVYLAVEAIPGASGKKGAWKGPSDLSVSFRGGYDDKNLYVLLTVTDDQQKNEQAEAWLVDQGDSMLLFIDANNDGGKAFRGEEFSLGAGLLKSGAPVGWRWVEHGKFLSGKSPLESVYVSRNEGAKTTTYQFAVPLETVALKAEPGKQFGFSFTAYDQDENDQGVQKAICPSPGAMQSPEPEKWAKGEFSK